MKDTNKEIITVSSSQKNYFGERAQQFRSSAASDIMPTRSSASSKLGTTSTLLSKISLVTNVLVLRKIES